MISLLINHFSHLRDDLCESTTGFITNPHFVLWAKCSTDGLELSVDRLIRKCLDTELRFARGVQLQMLSHCRVRKTLEVHKKPAERKGLLSEKVNTGGNPVPLALGGVIWMCP